MDDRRSTASGPEQWARPRRFPDISRLGITVRLLCTMRSPKGTPRSKIEPTRKVARLPARKWRYLIALGIEPVQYRPTDPLAEPIFFQRRARFCPSRTIPNLKVDVGVDRRADWPPQSDACSRRPGTAENPAAGIDLICDFRSDDPWII